MIAFIVFTCLMLLVAMAFVLVPLWRIRANAEGVNPPRLSDAISNVEVFRSQKREIDDEFSRGSINAEEHDAALSELSQRLVEEVPAEGAAEQKAAVRGSARRPWLLAGTLAVLIPVSAYLFYSAIGSPQAMGAAGTGDAAGIPAHAGAGPGADAQISDKQILALVDTLAQKMQENPGDPKGWVLLARSQAALGRYPEAVKAYERASQLLPADAQLIADYADVVVMAQQGSFEGKPLALIKQAIKLDPANLKALALAGTAELRLGNREASLKHWEKLKTLVVKDSDDYRQVEAIITEVKSGKAPIGAVAASPTPAAGPASAAPVESVRPAATTAAGSVADAGGKTGATVSGQVMLAAEFTAKLTPTDTLFVFARAKEGPRMPLAVLRIPAPKASDFPKTFELTDAMAMSPGMSLSTFPEVVIEARISRSGNAQLQPGDLSGVSDAIKPGVRAVTVTISRAVP